MLADNVIISVDRRRFEHNGDSWRVWAQWTYLQPRTFHDSSGTYWSSKSHIEIDCAKQSMRFLDVDIYYDKRGDVVRDASSSEPGEWQESVPGSLGEKLVEEFCAKTTRRLQSPD